MFQLTPSKQAELTLCLFALSLFLATGKNDYLNLVISAIMHA